MRDKEQWMEVAGLASKEQDPKKLSALVAEINRLLDEKTKRVDELRKSHLPSPAQS